MHFSHCRQIRIRLGYKRAYEIFTRSQDLNLTSLNNLLLLEADWLIFFMYVIAGVRRGTL